MSRRPGSLLLLCLATATAAAGGGDPYVAFEGATLTQGRVLWLENCEGCHGYGIAGAPVPMEPAAWRPRLDQPTEVLYRHAIDGFFGPDDTYMPPRGGNPKLSDDQVRSAVDYMAALARHYLDQPTKQTGSK